MIKSLERADPKSCWNKAREDERTFVLLERDLAMPATIRFWISERIRLGKNTYSDPQIMEAAALANVIEADSDRRRPV